MPDSRARQPFPHRVTAMPAIELPQELGGCAKLIGRDAGLDTDAVNTDLGQLTDEVRVAAALLTIGVAVDVHISAHDINLHRGRLLQPALHSEIELAQLFLDQRMSGGIETDQPPERDEVLYHHERVAPFGGHWSSQRSQGAGHRFSSAPASRAAPTSARFQNL